MTTRVELANLILESERTGRRLQYKHIGYPGWSNHPYEYYYHIGAYEYRLAPEPPKKRYRPWTRGEWMERRNEWVMMLNSIAYPIQAISDTSLRLNEQWFKFEEVLGLFKLLDGRPCGAEETE